MPDVRLVTNATHADPDLARLTAAVAARGLTVTVDGWRDGAVDWSDAAVTVLRSPWDYVDHLGEFLSWAKRVAAVTALWNPEPLVRWNTHKSYLLDLATRGAPVVPTVLLTAGSAASLDGIADAQGWNVTVVKPAVGVGARGAGRFDVGDEAGQNHLDDLLRRGDVLVQPYASAIEDEGEWSLILIDGRATHAIRKRPAAGDFRVHEEYGGRVDAAEPSSGLVELGERVCTVLPTPTLYARIDVVPVGGQWHVLEVEVTEPFLFLEYGPPEATERLVDAVVARLP